MINNKENNNYNSINKNNDTYILEFTGVYFIIYIYKLRELFFYFDNKILLMTCN